MLDQVPLTTVSVYSQYCLRSLPLMVPRNIKKQLLENLENVYFLLFLSTHLVGGDFTSDIWSMLQVVGWKRRRSFNENILRRGRLDHREITNSNFLNR